MNILWEKGQTSNEIPLKQLCILQKLDYHRYMIVGITQRETKATYTHTPATW